MLRALGRIASVLGVVATLLFVALAALPVLGASAMIVTSGSMEPTIATGSVVVIREVETEAIEVGDVLTYVGYGTDGATTHRVISRHELDSGTHFRTQGDANSAPDPDLVPAGGVLGRVQVSVPHVGWVLGWVRTPLGRKLALGVPAVLILVRELVAIRGAVRRREGPGGEGQEPSHGPAPASVIFAGLELPAPDGSGYLPATPLPPIPPPQPRLEERQPTATRPPEPPFPSAFSARPPQGPHRGPGRSPRAAYGLAAVALAGAAVGYSAAILTDSDSVGDNTFRTADAFLLP